MSVSRFGLLVLALLPFGAKVCAEEPVASLFARAALGEVAAEQELVDRGEEAARAAFEAFAPRPVAERRVRAAAILRTPLEASVRPALEILVDPDARVRETLVRFLARPELPGGSAEERLARLAERVREDPVGTVRQAALRALAEIDEPACAGELDRLVGDLVAPERALAAELLAGLPPARALARARLARAAAGDEPPDVFAALLVPCARDAADDPRGFETAAARAPIVVGLKHPDPRVRAAARSALDAHVSRLLAHQDDARALAVLAAFASDGFDPCRTLEESARIALLVGTRDDEALGHARQLAAAARAKESIYAREWSARAAHLEALAWIGRLEPERAALPLSLAARSLDDLLSARADAADRDGAEDHVRILFQRASVAVSEAGRILLGALVDGEREPERIPAAAIEALRVAHRHALEAQATAWRNETDAASSFDPVWRADVSLHELVLDVARRPGTWPARALALRRALGRAFASVARAEALGFEPEPGLAPEVADPHRDPVRRALLIAALDARCDQLALQASKARRALLRAALERPGGAEPEDQRDNLEAEFGFQDAAERRQRVADGDPSDLHELRSPSSFVVWLARMLREEGRAEEARPFLLRARAELDDSEVAQRFLWGAEMTAEIEVVLGGATSDTGDPRSAQDELEKAERRLSELENTLRERGAPPATLAIVRNQRCNALVALAVNANVRLHDPVQAVEWFEKAWEIRQDDFMRVLLACYRARQGRTHEARALVRDVNPGPGTLYNLACTWALLGDAEVALAFLKRDLDTNYPTAGGLAKQKEWARSDPDLESLRGDRRFEALVGSAK